MLQVSRCGKHQDNKDHLVALLEQDPSGAVQAVLSVQIDRWRQFFFRHLRAEVAIPAMKLVEEAVLFLAGSPGRMREPLLLP